jgi:hypothetical protein
MLPIVEGIKGVKDFVLEACDDLVEDVVKFVMLYGSYKILSLYNLRGHVPATVLVGGGLASYAAVNKFTDIFGHMVDEKKVWLLSKIGYEREFDSDKQANLFLETSGDLAEDVFKLSSLKLIIDTGLLTLIQNIHITQDYANQFHINDKLAIATDYILSAGLTFASYNQINEWGHYFNDRFEEGLSYTYNSVVEFLGVSNVEDNR